MHFMIQGLIRQGVQIYNELLIMINLSNLAIPNLKNPINLTSIEEWELEGNGKGVTAI